MLFLPPEEFHVLEEVLGDQLKVVGIDGGEGLSGLEEAAVMGGAVGRSEGIVGEVPVLGGLDLGEAFVVAGALEVGELLAKNSMIHVSVKFISYNETTIMQNQGYGIDQDVTRGWRRLSGRSSSELGLGFR